jgi:hypothetical protein
VSCRMPNESTPPRLAVGKDFRNPAAPRVHQSVGAVNESEQVEHEGPGVT